MLTFDYNFLTIFWEMVPNEYYSCTVETLEKETRFTNQLITVLDGRLNVGLYDSKTDTISENEIFKGSETIDYMFEAVDKTSLFHIKAEVGYIIEFSHVISVTGNKFPLENEVSNFKYLLTSSYDVNLKNKRKQELIINEDIKDISLLFKNKIGTLLPFNVRECVYDN